jgi:hypothetical protein
LRRTSASTFQKSARASGFYEKRSGLLHLPADVVERAFVGTEVILAAGQQVAALSRLRGVQRQLDREQGPLRIAQAVRLLFGGEIRAPVVDHEPRGAKQQQAAGDECKQNLFLEGKNAHGAYAVRLCRPQLLQSSNLQATYCVGAHLTLVFNVSALFVLPLPPCPS